MAQTTTLRLRGLWFTVHKWLGLLLAAAIIPIALSGSALVWHDWLDDTLNPQRHAAGAATLPPSAYASAARLALAPDERLLSLRFPQGEGAVVVTAARTPQPGVARPTRTLLWLDPADARLLDRAGSNDGAVRFLHVLHGRLQIASFGRELVGWVGVAMSISCLTGLWLWWPVSGSLRRGFRWKRQNSTNANLHHQMGFWVLVPLFMLSVTGVWISFPSAFGRFEAAAPRAGAPPATAPAQPLTVTATTADAALAAAGPHATGALVSIAWPTDQAPEWKIAYAREGSPAEVAVADASGEVTPPRPPRPETNARLMRRLHDGTGMGFAWQLIIFIGGIIPALLAITGIVMWLRSRGWKAKLARKRKARLTPQPAE